jgi:hypothetical protein
LAGEVVKEAAGFDPVFFELAGQFSQGLLVPETGQGKLAALLS